MKKKKTKTLTTFIVPQESLNQTINIEGFNKTPVDNSNILSIKKQKTIVFSKLLAKYAAIFTILLVLSFAKINGTIAPFAVGFSFALLCLKVNPLIVGPMFIASKMICSFTVPTLVVGLCVFASMLILKGITLITKKNMPIYLVPSFELFGLVGYIYFNIGSRTAIIETICYVIIAILFCYICYGFLKAAKERGILSAFSLDENICLSLLIMAFCLGLSGLYIWKFSLVTIVVCFAMLCLSKILGTKYSLYFAALAGLGVAFLNKSITSLSIFCAWAVAIAALSKTNRFVVVAGIFITDFLLGSYFLGYPVYTYINVLNVAIPSAVFCAIPNKVFTKISKQIEIDKNANGVLLADINREYLYKKLVKTSKLLQSMGENYQKIGTFQNKNLNATDQIASDVILRTCKNCENYTTCTREHGMQNEIISLADVGLKKSKVTLLDISKNVALYCNKTSSLISAINFSVAGYAKAEKLIEAEDNGRMAVGDQLIGTSRMIDQLAAQFSTNISNDHQLANIIYDELLENNIISKDIAVENGDSISVTMIVKSNEDTRAIEKAIKNAIKIDMQAKTSISKYAGYKLVKLTERPKYDISVGVAFSKKNEFSSSGDNYSVIDLDDDKVLIAICDGMGSGNGANDMSEKVLELVENFYRAGFDSDLILKNISHLMSTSEKEIYSTLDICIFNKNTGSADFVKASAPPTVCKSGDTSSLIFGQSTPIGIVDRPADVSMKLLSKGDIIVLASDGVVDCFATDEEYANYINNSQTINMSLFSETLIEEAKSRQKNSSTVPDDMTVLSLRVI